MVFSVNLFRHLYVAKKQAADVNETSTVGDIAVKGDNAKTHVYFKYMGFGGQMRSDLISTDNILYAKAVDASTMARKPKAIAVEFKSGMAPAVGQEYIVKIKYNQYIGLSDEDNYFEYGSAVATSSNTSQLFKDLALNLAMNTAKQGLVNVYLQKEDNGTVAVTANTKASTLTDSYNAILITEKEQDWVLGVKEQVPVFFEVYATPVMVNGMETLWMDTENMDITNDAAQDGLTTPIPNGAKMADLEYFCMGERGDIYRNVGWPNVIPTQYVIGAEGKGKSFHTFEIHYAYVGDNHAVQKSEKDITIVCEDKTELNKIISDFNAATGLNIAQL